MQTTRALSAYALRWSDLTTASVAMPTIGTAPFCLRLHVALIISDA